MALKIQITFLLKSDWGKPANFGITQTTFNCWRDLQKNVSGYTKSDGTEVKGYYRRR